MSEHLDFLGAGNTTIVIIVFLSIVVRYLFASGGAYVAAMVPVFATVGLVTGTAPALLALAIVCVCVGGPPHRRPAAGTAARPPRLRPGGHRRAAAGGAPPRHDRRRR